MSSQVKFSSKLATVLVAAGCSVGLGNIWRFPYVAGENGGGAFLLIYLACILIIGFPVMMSELAIGRATHLSAVGAFRQLAPRWKWLGYNGVLAAFLILGFYYVVAGWTAEYFIFSVTGELSKLSTTAEYSTLFTDFITHPARPILYTWIFVALTHAIIFLGVQKGLEKVSNVLMPLLFIILIALAINSILLPNSWEGVKFFLYPDFSKITPQAFLQAVGQAFFSLSIGLGALIAYGSYVPRDANLRTTTFQVMGLDTAVALLAGLIIFPATASVGIDPTAGPALVFETLPAIFNMLPMSGLWASIFFLLLVIAAITSTMSLHEVATVFFMEEFKLTRKRGALLTSVIVGVLGTAASLSLCVPSMEGYTPLFDMLDYVTANIMLPLGGMMTCIFVGWKIDKKVYSDQITNFGKNKCGYLPVLIFLLKYICPILIFIVFLDSAGIFNMFYNN
ncbi:MAG: sodium-dependent transporter [Rikenellaceae bacterium]